MARRPRGAKIPIGEIEKGAAKVATTVGGLLVKALKGSKKAPAKKVISKPAKSTKKPAVGMKPPRKAPAKKAPSSVRASKKDKNVSPTGRPVGRIAATPPERPTRDFYRRGETLPKTGAQQRASERQANRYLRSTGEPLPPKPRKATGGSEVRGSFVTPPRKARMQDRSKPASSSYEADTFRSQEKADRADIGRGQPRVSKKKPPAPRKPPPPKKPTPPAKPVVSKQQRLAELKRAVDSAPSGAAKNKAQTELRQYIIRNFK